MRSLAILALSFSLGCASLTSPSGTITLTGSGSRGCVGEYSHIDADGSIHGNCVQAESKFTDIMLGLASMAALLGM